MATSYEKFQKRLILAAYLRSRFGMTDAADPTKVKDFYRLLSEPDEGYRDQDGVSHLVRHLESEIGVPINYDDLLRYANNVRRHTLSINEHRDEPITWKYFQHVAALMTEYYLDRVTTDRKSFADDLDAYAEVCRSRVRGNFQVPSFTPDDLDKVAYWIATGGGKTLLMHLNYYQAQHHLDDIDHFLLLTPNTGLTRQHRQAMEKSGIPTVYYDNLRQRGGTFADEDAVKVVEIYLLTDDKTGEGKRVEVSTFEGDNLVFVDEGHKGAQSESETSWFNRREEIVGDGFTFEYSATYGQAVSKSGSTTDFEKEYGRSILFDYSYQRFYEDGYGKDFRILNLEPGTDDVLDANAEVERRYLLANLLAFYEQQFVFERNRHEFKKRFNLERPLLIFIGHTVTGDKTVSKIEDSKSDTQAVTDVQRLVRFLNDVLRNEDGWVEDAIDELLKEDGSLEIGGEAFFQNHFQALRETELDAREILTNLRDEVFHSAGGRLHLVNISNVEGEIGLRAGDADAFFGVIDVGNDRDFMKLVEEGLEDVKVDLEGSDFESALFKKIDQPESPINVLMGSRKFIEGWSSWRVASMGLMNFGTQKGPQIIQLFGRGVRLKGWNRSLKRTSALPEDADVRPPSYIGVLERLNIFGVRAEYMDEFNETLKGEGIDVEERVSYPIKTRMADGIDEILDKDLPVVRPDSEAKFEEPLSLSVDSDAAPKIDLTPQMEVILSDEDGEDAQTAEADRHHIDEIPDLISVNGSEENAEEIRKTLLGLLDWQRLYRQCWRHRNAEGYENLVFDAEDLRRIIAERAYTLKCPDWMIEWTSAKGRERIESITRRILEAYISSFYGERKTVWEQTTLQRTHLDTSDDNLLHRIEAHIKVSDEETQQDYRETLNHIETDGEDAEDLYEGTNAFYEEPSHDPPSRVTPSGHLYMPLMTQRGDVKHTPQGLNSGEEDFVTDLGQLLEDDERRMNVLGDRELYFLRNQSRGHGMGFAMENGKRFFPDFVLWILEEGHRHVVFVDPKGLTHEGSVKANSKVKFCRNGVKDIERQVRTENGRLSLSLHAFIVSVTHFDDVAENQELDTLDEFNEYHVYFQNDQPSYIEDMLRSILTAQPREELED